MADERVDWAIAQCEENGLAWARVFIEGQENSHYGLDVRHWIAKRERQEAEQREAAQIRLSQEAIGEARRAADASRKSARWTMIAAFAAAASALIPVLQGYGWLPKPDVTPTPVSTKTAPPPPAAPRSASH